LRCRRRPVVECKRGTPKKRTLRGKTFFPKKPWAKGGSGRVLKDHFGGLIPKGKSENKKLCLTKVRARGEDRLPRVGTPRVTLLTIKQLGGGESGGGRRRSLKRKTQGRGEGIF